MAAYLTELDLSNFDAKAPPLKTPAFWDIVTSNSAPEDSELADLIEALGNPDAVTVSQLVERATAGNDAADWLLDRRNRRSIPHRMERCGYTQVRNPNTGDGRWKLKGRNEVVYAKANLSVSDQMTAAGHLK